MNTTEDLRKGTGGSDLKKLDMKLHANEKLYPAHYDHWLKKIMRGGNCCSVLFLNERILFYS